MTVNELSQLYYLNEEIKKNKRKLQELRSRRGLHSQVIDDMPHGDGPRRSKDEDLTAMIIDLEEVIKARLVLIQKERIRLERYITTIPDSLTRQIFEDRFVSLMSWDEVAMDIGGGRGCSADRVKKICYRYLKRENEGLTARQAREAEKMADEYESSQSS
ncbi:MAG: hypothetical protein J5916_04440 [Oscillospiraceae bacterium]|nr:hypothetical protein [Oscillospiraceae bacterium]